MLVSLLVVPFLVSVGFINSLWIMAGGLSLIMFSGLMLPKGMGKIKKKVKFSQLFSKSAEINILSAARFFLFGLEMYGLLWLYQCFYVRLWAGLFIKWEGF